MKLIHFQRTASQPLKRDQALQQGISACIEDLTLDNADKNSWIHHLPTDKKEELLAFIKSAKSAILKNRNTQQNEEYSRKATFHCFPKLAIELRKQIWGEIIKPSQKPRVHALKFNPRTKTFISNQPVSPLLSICQESRDYYLLNTKNGFYFGTGVNYDIDTFHLLEIPDHQREDPEAPDPFQALDFRLIQKLAVTKELFLSVNGAKWLNFLGFMQRCHLTVVFDDERSSGVCWADLDVSFRKLSADEENHRADRSSVRKNWLLVRYVLEGKCSLEFAHVDKESSIQHWY
ncbi:hypothetical protein HYFRA_00006054 [Hymenoscyphus fraxineus]|uniref:2EXR domain-containing protein n=1 Tax=Hymenoscyphus fraxineus TaxID=746836 RepID=A0A9N9PUD8_9HELO|nr:hypothetical protein HYFRA_00006054 [Hymenoscyphus fraxineus]